MRSHTGGVISIGHGVMHEKASVQRSNKEISTEEELVGVSKYLPSNLWLMLFLHGHGYRIMKNIVYQYNQSAISIEKMGAIIVLKTRDIYISNIFVKDRVDKGEVKI